MWLPRRLYDLMVVEADEKVPRETGGILLGYEVAKNLAVVVTDLVGAGPGASYSREEFMPDGVWQEREVARVYERSGRLATYLGDWHSHPDGWLNPSRKDHRTARAIGRHAPARIGRPLMIIVACEDGSWRLAAFRLRRRKLRPMQLRAYADGGRAESRSR